MRRLVCAGLSALFMLVGLCSGALAQGLPPTGAIGSISGRLVDADTGAPIVNGFSRRVTADLKACNLICSRERLAREVTDAEGRFRFELDSEGQPIQAGNFQLLLLAEGYVPTAFLTFPVGENENRDFGDIELTSQELLITNHTECDIPFGGGRCQYEATIRNNRSIAQVATAFSSVTVGGRDGAVRFEASTQTGQNPERAELELAPFESRQVSFGFDVPPSTPPGTEVCVQIHVGTGPAPAFQVKASLPLAFCRSVGFRTLPRPRDEPLEPTR